jgi:hypothetical protein
MPRKVDTPPPSMMLRPMVPSTFFTLSSIDDASSTSKYISIYAYWLQNFCNTDDGQWLFMMKLEQSVQSS